MKVTKGKISFIIPVYNGASFIDEAYENILNQKLKDFEIIFVDNNSKDDSIELIKQLQLNDSRVQLFLEKKQGAAAARNKGIKEAEGEFIHFFDIDDLLYDTAINSLLTVLIKNKNIQSVFGNSTKSSERLTNCVLPESNEHVIIYPSHSELTYRWLIHKSKLKGPPAFLHRKEVVLKLKGFKENLLLGEDAFFHIRLSNEFDIGYLDKYIYHYYRHQNSTVSKDNQQQKDKVFTYWPPLIKAYLPYCKTDIVSEEFKLIVLKQIYGSIGKMIVLTSGVKNRIKMKKKCIQEIIPIKVPFIFNVFLYLIIFTGSLNLYKFYTFYVVTPYINNKKTMI